MQRIDPSMRCRLTMEFCEDPDGSGKRWTLTMYLYSGDAPEEITFLD